MNKHAELMKQYADDWATTYEPWTLWEVRDMDAIVTKWQQLETHPMWQQNAEYRRKPQTRTITLPPTKNEDAVAIRVCVINSQGDCIADFDLGYFDTGYNAVEYLQRLKDELK